MPAGKELESQDVLTHGRLLWLATLKPALDFFWGKRKPVLSQTQSVRYESDVIATPTEIWLTHVLRRGSRDSDVSTAREPVFQSAVWSGT